MPVLFFIAGYFAVSSFQTNGIRRFLKKKCKRLGLPLLIGIPLIGPSFSFIYRYTRNGFAIHESFSAYWVDYMQSVADFPLGIITSIDTFSHSHLWFMSLLLFFFIVFGWCARHRVGYDKGGVTAAAGSPSANSLWILASVAFLSAVSALIGSMLFASPSNPEPWVTVFNILQFQPDNIGSYILYFSMGIYAYTKKWFMNSNFPGHPGVWCVSCVLMSIFLLICLWQVVLNFSLGAYLAYLFVRSCLCASFLAAFSAWAVRNWNRPSKFDASLAANSYHIYITHFLLVILMQLLLAGWSGGSVFIKFGVVSVVSILASYAISNYALRPFPRLSISGFYIILVIMFTYTHP